MSVSQFNNQNLIINNSLRNINFSQEYHKKMQKLCPKIYSNKLNDFILIHSIIIRVNNSKANESLPCYFVNEKPINGKINNVYIFQKSGRLKADLHSKAAVRFYNWYSWTKGIMSLLKNIDESLNYCRLLNTVTNDLYLNKFNINLDIYIKKSYLLNIYSNSKIPKFLYQVIKDSNTINLKDECNKIKVTYHNLNTKINKNYKRIPYQYQKDNINWMINCEYNILNKFPIKTFKLPSNIENVKYIKEINDYIITDSKRNLYEKTADEVIIYLKGGVLCDEVGLGKSLSMISLINEQKSENSKVSLILAPRRLLKQWGDEIDKTCNLKYKIVGTVSQYKKLIKNEMNIYDIVIMSYNFLINKNYKKLLENLSDDKIIDKYLWERVILDEGHEFLCNWKDNKCKKSKTEFKEIKKSILNIKSYYRWICSATPYTNYVNSWYILDYIYKFPSKIGLIDCTFHERYISKALEYLNRSSKTIFNLNPYYHIYKKLCNNVFRRNTRESIKHQVIIPEPSIITDFLDMTSIERAIYDSALGNKNKMIELCNHILVSDAHISILGNKPLTLQEIHNKMTNYCNNKIKKLEKRINNINKELKKLNNIESKSEENIINKIKILDDKLKKAKELLKEFNAKYNIFNNLNKRINENSSCIVCYDDLNKKTNVILECGHFLCANCITEILKLNQSNRICPMCRKPVNKKNLDVILNNNNEETKEDSNINKWGTKTAYLIKYINNLLQKKNNRIIVFSQWNNMLKLISKVLDNVSISHIKLDGSLYTLNSKIRKFKLDTSIRVILLCSDKAASGLNLTEANNIILLDTLNTDKEKAKLIEKQAIGRAVRIGQKNKVNVKRFIMNNTIEYDYYLDFIN